MVKEIELEVKFVVKVTPDEESSPIRQKDLRVIKRTVQAIVESSFDVFAIYHRERGDTIEYSYDAEAREIKVHKKEK